MSKIIVALIGKAGAGKDTVAKELATANPHWNTIVSCTTRPKREGEEEGEREGEHTTSTSLVVDIAGPQPAVVEEDRSIFARFTLRHCPSLTTIKMGVNAFRRFYHFELSDCPSLVSINMKAKNFRGVKDFVLEGRCGECEL